MIDFRIAVKEEYKELSDKATKYLLPFINTEHAERKFSSYAYVKTNIEIGQNTKLIVEENMKDRMEEILLL